MCTLYAKCLICIGSPKEAGFLDSTATEVKAHGETDEGSRSGESKD